MSARQSRQETSVVTAFRSLKLSAQALRRNKDSRAQTSSPKKPFPLPPELVARIIAAALSSRQERWMKEHVLRFGSQSTWPLYDGEATMPHVQMEWSMEERLLARMLSLVARTWLAEATRLLATAIMVDKDLGSHAMAQMATELKRPSHLSLNARASGGQGWPIDVERVLQQLTPDMCAKLVSLAVTLYTHPNAVEWLLPPQVRSLSVVWWGHGAVLKLQSSPLVSLSLLSSNFDKGSLVRLINGSATTLKHLSVEASRLTGPAELGEALDLRDGPLRTLTLVERPFGGHALAELFMPALGDCSRLTHLKLREDWERITMLVEQAPPSLLELHFEESYDSTIRQPRIRDDSFLFEPMLEWPCLRLVRYVGFKFMANATFLRTRAATVLETLLDRGVLVEMG